jgi:hypothetical protein
MIDKPSAESSPPRCGDDHQGRTPGHDTLTAYDRHNLDASNY